MEFAKFRHIWDNADEFLHKNPESEVWIERSFQDKWFHLHVKKVFPYVGLYGNPLAPCEKFAKFKNIVKYFSQEIASFWKNLFNWQIIWKWKMVIF